jgi:hypothetical protein
MKKVLTELDTIAKAYEERKKDETIILKNENNENQLKPDTSKDIHNAR